MLYATCSILKQENVEQMQAFLERHKDAVAVPFDNDNTNWGIEQEVGRQCLPVYKHSNALEPTLVEDDKLDGLDIKEQQGIAQAPAGGDGFYYAVIKKQS